MDEASAPKAAQHGVARWQSRWLLPGGPAVVLAALTIDVLANGPLVRLDRQVWSAVRPIAHSPGWQWAGGGAFSPAQIVVDLADPHLAALILQATCWLADRAGWAASTGPQAAAGSQHALPGDQPAARTPG